MLPGYGQQGEHADSAHMLKEVVITGFQENGPKYTSVNITSHSLRLMNDQAPYNLSDALAKLPGIAQMTTGNAITKPVIRGLYGNRILVLYSGMRFDNQQWQDEHGLGLSQIGIDRVEVIKGPASLLYGSDALGGVINIIEEKPALPGLRVDAGTQVFTNSRGTLIDAGISNRAGNSWSRIRLGIENHGDYSGGDGVRVLNSRNNGYYLKTGFGFDRKKWVQENSFNFSYNRFGFIIEDLNTFFAPDERWSRSMNGPHHIVILGMGSTQNTFYLPKSVLRVNVGVQSNTRNEDEGGGQISLSMELLSVLQSLKWEKELSKKVSFVANQQYTYENNTNYGGRIIIPDATFMEWNGSGYFKFRLGKIIAEAGAGINDKYIKTIATRSLNMPGDPIQPFAKNSICGNGMAGVAWNPNAWLTVKTNTATGFRAPNLAELSANGVHEGVYRYEIGDPKMAIEQNINTDLSVVINRKQWGFSASVYHQRFLNYVYLAPTTDSFYGFQVFRYRQQDARIYGSECQLVVTPEVLKGIQFSEGFTSTRGVLDNNGNLPYIPAYKFTSSVQYQKLMRGRISRFFVEPGYVHVFKQDVPAQFETNTASYYLINCTSGITIAAPKGDWRLGLTGTNLTNKAYVDHLSRLKYYGLLNQGINFVISVRKEFK